MRCNFHSLVDANVHSESDKHEVDESCKGEENLVELDPYSLEKFVAENDIVFVNFCVDNSGKCRLLSSEFAKAAASSRSGAWTAI